MIGRKRMSSKITIKFSVVIVAIAVVFLHRDNEQLCGFNSCWRCTFFSFSRCLSVCIFFFLFSIIFAVPHKALINYDLLCCIICMWTILWNPCVYVCSSWGRAIVFNGDIQYADRREE